MKNLAIRKRFFFAEALFCLFSLAYVFADNLHLLLLIRFLHGIWFSIVTTVAVPIVNEFIPEKRKGEGMGYFVMSINLGIVLGPFLGLTLIQSVSYPMVAGILAFSVCLGFLFCFFIPFSRPPKN